MRKQLTYGILLIITVAILVTSVIVWKRAAVAPTQGHAEPAPQTASSTAPTALEAKVKLTIQERNGTRRTVEATNRTGQASVPQLKAIETTGAIQIVAPIMAIPDLEPLYALDPAAKTLDRTPIFAHLLIGKAGTELVYFVSTRYSSYDRRNELNEVRAYDPATRVERTLEVLPVEFSYTKKVTGPLLTPSGKATITRDAIRVEAYFTGPYLYPGQERLPLQIHTVPLTASGTKM